MVSIKGIYDGKRVKPIGKIKAKKNSEVIIIFFDEEEAKTDENNREFWKTFGAWKGVDTDRLIEEIYEDRKISRRKEVLM